MLQALWAYFPGLHTCTQGNWGQLLLAQPPTLLPALSRLFPIPIEVIPGLHQPRLLKPISHNYYHKERWKSKLPEMMMIIVI